MSGIVGISNIDGAPMDRAIPAAMLATIAHRGPDGDATHALGSAGLGQCMRHTTPESRLETLPLVSADGRIALVADARIDNREELWRELGAEIPFASLAQTPDGALILAAYQRFGPDCVDRLYGDFAFALFDADADRWFCARDPFGVRCLYFFYRPGQVFGVASEIKALLAAPGTPRELDELRVAYFLTAVFEDEEITFYKGIRKLPAGRALLADKDGCRVYRHFDLDPKFELRLENDEEYAEGYLERFREAVRVRLRATAPILSTMSGGLDSTSIACTARDLLQAQGRPPLLTMSAIFPSFTGRDAERIDERSFVADVTAEGGLEPHYVEVDRVSPMVDLDVMLRLQDEAILTPNYYMHWAMYGAAQDLGAGVFLDGVDGDTTVSHGIDHLVDLALALRPFRLWKELKELSAKAAAKRSVKRLAKENVLRPIYQRVMHPIRRFTRRGNPRPWGDLSLIREDFARELDLATHVNALRGDPPKPEITSRAVHRSGLLSPIVPHALEVADRGTNHHGLEARYPFCDRRLAEYCVSLPGSQKLREGLTRYVMRTAMKDILPESVQWRRSKSDLSPSLFQGLRTFEAARVRQATENQSEAVTRFLDMEAFRKSVDDYEKGGNAEAFRLYGALSLMRWLELAGFA